MALGDPYVTLPEMRAYLKIEPERTEMNPALEAAIAAASKFVDRHCHRQFNKSDIATTRTFKVLSRGRSLWVDDFYTTDGLVIDGAAWDSKRYDLYPGNGVYEGVPGWPFYRLDDIRYGNYGPYARFGGLGSYEGSVTVTAKWGWAEVPAPIKQATYLQAGHLYKMADAPNGVAGMDQFGAIRIRSLPQVTDLLCDYVRNKVLVG